MVVVCGQTLRQAVAQLKLELLQPCQLSIYIFCQEYKAAGEPQGGPAPAIMTGRHAGKSLFMFGYNFVSTDIRSEKETW